MTLYTLPAVPLSPSAWREAHSGAWRPGLGAPCRHAEIFASAGEGSGAGAALALALDALGSPEHPGEPHPIACAPDERPWLWVQDRAALRLSGRPYLPGLPPALRHRLIHIAAPTPEDALFALEEGVRCRDLAFVLGEIAGNPRALDFTASRRLSLAAEKHGVPLWLVRLDAARDLGSARMRWQVRSHPSPQPQWNPQAPGTPSWDAELFRAHTFQPGRWVLREEGELVAEAAVKTVKGARASILRQAQDERGSARTGFRLEQTPLSLSLSKATR